MSKLSSIFKFGMTGLVYSFLCCQTAFADDTEIFFSENTSSTSGNPNILFILETSGGMNGNDDNGDPKVEVLKEVLAQFFAEQSGINMGLMNFSGPGGPILYPVSNPDETDEPIILTSVSTGTDDGIEEGNSVNLEAASGLLDPSASGGQDEVIAIRFENVNIPQGAVITSATLLFGSETTSAAYEDGGGSAEADATYEISIQEINGSSPALSDSNNALSALIPDAVDQTPVVWAPDPWAEESSVESPATYETSELKTILQEVVDNNGGLDANAGWCGGNAMTFILKKTGTGGRPIMAYEKNSNFAPKLSVVFEATVPAAQSGCYVNTLYSTVVDDANADTVGTEHDSDSTSGVDSGELNFQSAVAFSFLDVGIPQGAVISNAQIRLYPNTDSRGQTKAATISMINDVTPPTNETVLGLTSTLTDAWSLTGWEPGTRVSSGDLSTNLQTLVNDASWTEDSDLSFKITGGSNKFVAYSFDGLPSQAPSIEVSYVGRYTPSSATKRNALIAAVADFKVTSGSPVASTFAEAGLYYKGEGVRYGLVRGSPTKRDSRISHEDSVVGTANISTPSGCTATNPSATACKSEAYVGDHTYKTPVLDECQSNNIVLMLGGSDPSSNMDSYVSTAYNNWVNEFNGLVTEEEKVAVDCTVEDSSWHSSIDKDQESCIVRMAGLFYNDEVIPASTHTISFGNDSEFLKEVANTGHGQNLSANTKNDLLFAFREIADGIVNTNTTFVSAGVTVNQYNQLTHNDELYFSLFEPSADTVWPGNVKRYKLSGGKLVDSSDPAVDATDSDGKFAANAKSWWSTAIDGNLVDEGGAASRLSATREVFSNLAGDTTNLKLAANQISSANVANITPSLVGAGVDTDRRDLILDWVKGIDVNDSGYPGTSVARQTMGDPLHSQPTLLTYANGDGTFTTTVFVSTNEGFLHSFNTETGDENWAFIPQELLGRLSAVVDNDETKHATYGLDGSVTIYIDEKDTAGNTTGVVDTDEVAYLYIGMRRGGSYYYALDVSDVDSPEMKFKISPTGDYSGLGQTWSKPVIKKVKALKGDVTSTEKLVMMFGGGYSTDQDTAGGIPVAASTGKNVYIADALNGTLLWDVSDATQVTQTAEQIANGEPTAGLLTAMDSVPNAIVAFDFDGDEYIDHFYASDTKAQVFRFDIDGSTGEVTGGRVAHMNAATVADNRRFYNAPDIAYIRLTSGSFVSISIGSGYRAHPNDESVKDKFFVIKDKGIIKGVFDMDADLASLADVTSKIGSSASEAVNADGINGWYLDFSTFSSRVGEKVLSDSITFNNAVIFTTFTPATAADSSCGINAGTSRLYLMSIIDGNPYTDTNSDSLLNSDDRLTELSTEGIAPKPQILITPEPLLVVGTEVPEPEPPKTESKLIGIKWHNQ